MTGRKVKWHCHLSSSPVKYSICGIHLRELTAVSVHTKTDTQMFTAASSNKPNVPKMMTDKQNVACYLI
jgi:hypothetical protein